MGAYSVTAAMRDDEGKLPQWAWPGGYIIVYLDKENSTLCAKCASLEPDENLFHGSYHEGPDLECDECGKTLESDYGDPEEEE